MTSKLSMEAPPTTGLFTIVTDLDPATPVEQIRSCYENIGTVLRNKVYSTSKFGKIAILEVDDVETLIRASCRRVQSGDYQQQSIYTFRRQVPQIRQLINKKTKLKLTYDLQEERDPQEFKESLLQLLSKVGGCYFIKKVKSLGRKNELILSIESCFSLSKLSSNAHFMFKQVKISFVHVEDKLDDSVLEHILLPEYITTSPKLFASGANMNHVIQAFCQRLFSRCKEEEEESMRQRTRQDFRFWQSNSDADDKLEDLFEESNEDHPEYVRQDSKRVQNLSEALNYFIPEKNIDFLVRFESTLWKDTYHSQLSEPGEIYVAVDPCLTKGLNNASALKKQGKQDIIDSNVEKDPAIPVPVELKLIEMLQKMKEFCASQSEAHPQAMLREVYSSIAGKIDPDTPPQQMLRVTLKILKTKYRKVKRRERKKDSRAGRDIEDQDESGDDDFLGVPSAQGHSLILRAISNLQNSPNVGYNFGSEELWKILQSCDPEWREFIWKYRTLELVPESHFTATANTLFDQKVCLQVQTTDVQSTCWAQSLNDFQRTIPGKNYQAGLQCLVPFERDFVHDWANSTSRLSSTFLQSYYPAGPQNDASPGNFSMCQPDPRGLDPFCPNPAQPPAAPKPASHSAELAVGIPGDTATQPAVCPTPAASQPAQSRPPGEDRWISQHLESNLRFNRMVSPILWR